MNGQKTLRLYYDASFNMSMVRIETTASSRYNPPLVMAKLNEWLSRARYASARSTG